MTDSNNYQIALQLAEEGKYEQALEKIQEHLRTFGEDAQALNDAGAILHCLGKSSEAVDCLNRAKKISPDAAEIIWNLAEANLVAGLPTETSELFDKMGKLGILNADIINRTANVFLNQDNKAGAVEMLLRSLRLSSEQDVLKPMLEIIKSKRPKIAFFCGSDGANFIKDIIPYINQRFLVEIYQGKTEEQLYELMQWSDISWFEWCTQLAQAASKWPKVCKTIVRLHRYEAYGPWPEQINWDNIDVLINIGNTFIADRLISKVPDIQQSTSLITIPNGVNLEKFRFSSWQRGKNIAFLGNLRMVKNPALVIQCMQKLHYIDPEYRLFFGGECPDPALEQYLHHIVQNLDLEDVVIFDGRLENVPGWLEDKHYIVSTSIIESQGMGILEGMACGLKPVIHNFPGADQIFPKEHLFNIAEEFCEQICSDNYEPSKYRRFVEENYSLDDQLLKIADIFNDLEEQIESSCAEVVASQADEPGNL